MTDTNNAYGKRPLWQWVVIYLIIGGIVYAGFYYFVFAKKGGYGNNYQASQYVQSPPPSAIASPTPVTAMQVTITGKEFVFDPTTVIVKKGQPVEIVFRNAGAYPHNLTLVGLNVQTKTVQPREQDTLSFTPKQAGTYSFMCTVPGHADKGMKGTLTVQ